MKACPEYDVRLSLHAAGALEPAEAEEVRAHLAACPGCRAEAEADAAVLAAVRLPPATPAEREVLRELPARTVGAFRALERARVRTRRFALGGLAAAAALLAVVLTGADPTATATATPTATPTATATPTPSWKSPDLDDLWDDTAPLAHDATSAAYASDDDALTATDVTLAAWDDAGL